MNVNTKRIAEICGVSRGTVDRALNNRPGINAETKEKILRTARELVYKPDFIAQSLVTGKTKTIGVVVFDVFTRFFGQLVNSIEMQAKAHGFFVYLTLSHKDHNMEYQCIEHLMSRKVDGIIIFSVNKGPDFAEYLNRLGIPVTTIVNKVDEIHDYVGINDRKALQEVVKHIADSGHKNICYVSTPDSLDEHTNMYAIEERLAGFLEGCKRSGKKSGAEGMEDRGITDKVIKEHNYTQAVVDLMNSPDRPTAIVCSNDIYALEILRVLEAKGWRIPQDVSLVGFDDIDILQYIHPPITTVSYPIDEIGKHAVDILLQKNKQGKPGEMLGNPAA